MVFKTWVQERISSLIILDIDDEVMSLRKTSMFVLYVLSFILNGSVYFVTTDAGTYTSLVMMVVCAAFFVHLVTTKRMTTGILSSFLGICCLGITIYDFVGVAEGRDRAWPVQVIIIDVLLVNRVDPCYNKIIVVFVLLYLALITFESMFRFGLFDLPGLSSQEDRTSHYSCDKLPCADISRPLQSYIISIAVFLLDFYFTRGFAESLLKEKAKVEASVETAERIAGSLADFDLDTAEDVLNLEQRNLPPKLFAAFDNILQNLRMYKPFLPDALFESEGDTRHDSPLKNNIMPPGTGSGDQKVAIAFTDIEGSTAIWEACPSGMKKGLKLHNKTIRQHIDLCQGYEVKTIGDAFMVAFSSSTDAVDFALSVQSELTKCQWPADLLELPMCAQGGDGLWNGIRVRIGIHYGEAEPELNAIIGRFDYFGNTVNVAARVEAASVGGAIVVTPEVLEELDSSFRFVEIPMGAVSLKGVTGTKKLSAIIPQSLQGRRSYVQGRLQSKRSSNTSNEMAQYPQVSDGSLSRVTAMSEQPETNSRLEHIANATVACVEVKTTNGTEDYSAMNEKVCRTLHVLDRCGGTVVAVVGSVITVGWNTAKKTSTHFESSLRFTSLILNKGSPSNEIRVGLSTGSAVTATIGTNVQRFVTVIGDLVTLSGMMAASASEFKTSVLFSSSSLSHFFAGLRSDLKSILRPLTTWDAHTHDRMQPLVVYEVSVARLDDTDLTSMIKHERDRVVSLKHTGDSWCWSDDYWNAFATNNQRLIAAHQEEDEVILSVQNSLCKGKKVVTLAAS